MSVVIRKLDAIDGDAKHFVLNSWLQSYRPRGCALHGIDQRNFYRTHHPEFTHLLRKSTIALASLADDLDVYLGWACGDFGVLHYVYMKAAFRRAGVGDLLLAAVCGTGPIIHTFEPPRSDGRVRRPLLEVAERRGYKYHPHPIPGVEVLKQHQERTP